MKILKTSLNIVLSFLIIIVIFSILALNILEKKILNKDYILNKMEETEIYIQISREIDSGFENYIYQSGLPVNIIKNLYSNEVLRNDVNSIVNAIYDGTEIEVSDDIIRKNLDNKINEFLNSENKKLNKQGQKNVEKFKDLIVKEYKNNISLKENICKKANELLIKIEKIVDKLKVILPIIIIVIGIILLINNFKNLLKIINYVGISFLSVGVLIKIGISIIFSKINIDKIVFITISLSNLLINIIKDILYKLSDYSMLFIVIGITSIVIVAILENIQNDDSKTKVKKSRRFKKVKE